MHYIQEFREGEQIRGVYLVKEIRTGETKTGKPYETVIIADKTGTIDGKIWDLNNPAIYEFDAMEFVNIVADVRVYNNSPQLNIRAARVAEKGSYVPSDYIATSDFDTEEMYLELIEFVNSVENQYLKALLEGFFLKDEAFIKDFKGHSAAKTVHHKYAGGLLEHTLHVTRMCDYLARNYPQINRDLLITGGLCHDIGKVTELSDFPLNDYTDAGQLLGHIIIGTEMITDKIRNIEGFPVSLANQLKHCILSHHGEYEYGSPKLPSTLEAIALNKADECDAKLETMIEIIQEKGDKADKDGWMGFSRFFETNLRKTEF